VHVGDKIYLLKLFDMRVIYILGMQMTAGVCKFAVLNKRGKGVLDEKDYC